MRKESDEGEAPNSGPGVLLRDADACADRMSRALRDMLDCRSNV